MREYEARRLAATINGDYIDWEATVEPGIAGWQVLAIYEEGGRHVLVSPSDWEDVKALVYGEEEEEE